MGGALALRAASEFGDNGLSPIELIEFDRFMKTTKARCSLIRTPVIVVQGLADKLVKPVGTYEMFNKINSSDKALIAIGNADHLILETTNQSEVLLRGLSAWLDKHIRSTGRRMRDVDEFAQNARIRQGAVEEVVPQDRPGKKNIVWIPIPKWLAGTWSKQGDLTVSYTDLRSGFSSSVNQWTPNFQTTTWGNQSDGGGNIWHGYSLPAEIDGISSGKTVKFFVIGGQCEPSSPDHLITRVRSIVISSYGRQVEDEFQQEALNDLCLLQSGELANYGSTRDFSNQGVPLRQGLLISRFTKVRSCEPVEFQDGVDLVKSLNEFLKTHNMSHLMRKTAADASAAPR